MIRGIYTAASGMRMQFDLIDIYANNLANAQTNGYKRNEVVAQSFPEMLVQMAGDSPQTGRLGQGVRQVDVVQDMSAGILEHTGRTMNIALEGEGFFVIRKDPERMGVSGQPVFQQTRNGAFMVDSKRRLVNGEGFPVMDINNQPITLSQETVNNIDSSLLFRADGSVVERLGGVDRVAGKLKVAMVKHIPGINPMMGGKDSTMQIMPDQSKQPKIIQGYLEESNISTVTEMVNLTQAAKVYDTAQKAVMSQDKMLDKSINEMGRAS